MIEILSSCIESIFSLFKMEIEFVFLNALKFMKAVLGITPKALDSVYVISIAFRKFIIAMINPKMLFITKVNQNHHNRTSHQSKLRFRFPRGL